MSSLPTVVIDLYDSGVLISDGEQVLVDSASCALIEPDKSICVGELAEQQAHIRPREISTHFWSQLSADSNTKYVISNAEIAFKHLQFIWGQLEKPDYKAILATPDTLSKQDLGLLLGICEKLSIAVSGIVSKAVLAPQRPVTQGRLVYLDVMQRQIAVTNITQSKTGVTVTQASTILAHGLQSLVNNLAKSISHKFIAETRFDPMHKAEDEQQFFEKLSHWLLQLETADSVECELISDSNHYCIQLHKKHLLNINQFAFKEIANCLNALFQDQDAVAIICSPTCAQVFGLVGFLKALPGCAVLTLDQNSAAKYALLNQEQIKAKTKHIHYTTTLERNNKLTPLELDFNTGSLSDLDKTPTHLLIDNYACSLAQEVFINKNSNANNLIVNSISSDASLCKISTEGLLVEIKTLNNCSIKLNDEPLITQQSVQIGDRLSIEGHADDLHFIKVNQDETQIGKCF